MAYFSPAFLQFFRELSENNATAWFNDNRKTYEKDVKKPFADFTAEMIDRIHEYEPEVQIKPADAIMRINKDIRFSKDKTPYNTYMGANISKFGKKDKSYPGFYFQLSPEGIKIYGGTYMVETPVLQNIRTYIADNLSDFSKACNSTAFQEKFGAIQGEQNKRIPAEFQEVLAKEPLIANKQFYYAAELNPDLTISDNLPEKLMEYYLAGREVNAFLQKAILVEQVEPV